MIIEKYLRGWAKNLNGANKKEKKDYKKSR
jgi:hypothetical protein